MEPLKVAFLWHQHQPNYRDPGKKIFLLPWVRMHALKDYYDMVEVLDGFPQIHQNFNLVPSLLEQLDDYLQNRYKDHVEILTEIPASQLNEAQKSDILKYFFQANWHRLVMDYPGYLRLLDKRGTQYDPDDPDMVLRQFTEQDFLDLQVWYNLCWTGEAHKKVDPFRSLIEKDHDFTEEDKRNLLEAQRDILHKIIGKHKELSDRGQIEISASPFYHPILPLLCDSQIAKESQPGIRLPQARFRGVDDAREQISRALAYQEEHLGSRPRGMWPSEGSVSQKVAEIMAENGVEWIATDEEILFASLHRTKGYVHSREDLYKPWRVTTPKGEVSLFFRDHELSDLIGFVYQSWDAHKAASDFVGRLKGIREHLIRKHGPAHLEEAVVSVILDGENCWEFYPENGRPFLEALYAMISEDQALRSVTFSEHLDESPAPAKLKSLFPGSWINGNFAIWIGHPEDNLAWDYLHETRNELLKAEKAGRVDPEILAEAKEEILIAEGSDWCWWYGDDHATDNADEFDSLFRSHLIRVYELLEMDVPVHLFSPIRQEGFKKLIVAEPRGFISPRIDGRETDYFEWLGAGTFETQHQGESMHRMAQVVESIVYGFDLENFYLKIRLSSLETYFWSAVHSLELDILEPNRHKLLLTGKTGPDSQQIAEIVVSSNGKAASANHGLEIAARNCIELKIPFAFVKGRPDDGMAFQLSILENGELLEKWPRQDLIRFSIPGPNFEELDWSV